MPQPADDRAGGRRLAGIHAGPGKRNDRHTARIQRDVRIERPVARARRDADALRQIRKVKHRAQHFAVERRADFRVRRITDAQHAADVEDLHDGTDFQGFRQVTRVAEQGLAVAQCADDDVALVDGGHAAAHELELVVARLVVQHARGEQHAFLAGNLRGHPQLVSQLRMLRDRGNLVDEHGAHRVHGASPAPPARLCSMPASEAMREKPSASAAFHSPAASP